MIFRHKNLRKIEYESFVNMFPACQKHRMFPSHVFLFRFFRIFRIFRIFLFSFLLLGSVFSFQIRQFLCLSALVLLWCSCLVCIFTQFLEQWLKMEWKPDWQTTLKNIGLNFYVPVIFHNLGHIIKVWFFFNFLHN